MPDDILHHKQERETRGDKYMTQLERTHAASDRNPSVTLHDKATTPIGSTASSIFDTDSTVLHCALTKWGLKEGFALGNDPPMMPEAYELTATIKITCNWGERATGTPIRQPKTPKNSGCCHPLDCIKNISQENVPNIETQLQQHAFHRRGFSKDTLTDPYAI
jgi:hypothetical protein